MNRLSIGVMSRSGKVDERRLPLHPLHLDQIDADVRGRIYLEQGYGEQFGMPDERLAPLVGGLLPREQLIAECDVILLAKPLLADIGQLREGQILWGWPHCVQDPALTQLAIDKKLTLIAFEAMNEWTADGDFKRHILQKNNELAGYASVVHALSLVGSTGVYGRPLRAAVIGSGSTARGAVTALGAHGVTDVSLVTPRAIAPGSVFDAARIVPLVREDGAGDSGGVAAGSVDSVLVEGKRMPLPDFLAGHDVIVNCVLQDPNQPLTFLRDADLALLAPGTLVVDVSCDAGMGFAWARPTTFANPVFTVGDNVTYYAVDHSPSYLWDSATWEISAALLPYLEDVLRGENAWGADETLRRAIEIRNGVIQNPSILAFQNRSADYPHLPLA
ncbi:alanine dehydrogenase [Cryobacterium sp. TMT1-21]|uniref:Alanine dehydrogenase n=1 Tax=Cryobacterium shii TaxID=1259235 RepID=A0AAQ2C435_9MICO|nr:MULTISPECIES: N(5)-(carboxyethyl)ornithine synthase [Cryobacterium]TFC42540.1 alanine dehydrogenase [Cryobacterium shii]TFC80872.1 alanine dehydrogenase [Cryobacterium sp. TmT2-59]TFD13201.1 alanine dehydrogenase [Cryobacterium sp. TMT1-21]TFD18622.1 alanine dehydrogenase [Cryobacterium sp. TMT4-10]TFD28422.1 alanine dehydrogenase [Cryobacterium sp. TMT2-23]